MKYKKIYLLVCLLICVLSMASVCASEVNDTAATATDVENNLEINNDNVGVDDVDNSSSDFKEDDLGISAPNSDSDKINSTDNDVVGSAGSENLDDNNDEIDIVGSDDDSKVNNDGENVLGEDQIGDFNILKQLINRAETGETIYLDRDYTFTEGLDDGIGNGIMISMSNPRITLDGNGHTIDARGKIRIFEMNKAVHFTLKNIVFMNGHDGTAGDGGGAIIVGKESELRKIQIVNCTFINNYAKGYGGAIRWEKTGLVISNCTFINNSAGKDGAAIYCPNIKAQVYKCSFVNNIGRSVIYGNVGGHFNDSFFINKGYITALNVVDEHGYLTLTVDADFDEDSYFGGSCKLYNVAYWNGEWIDAYFDEIYDEFYYEYDFGEIVVNPIPTNLREGPNFIIEVYSGDTLVDNESMSRDGDGHFVYTYSKLDNENYNYKIYHPEDYYYTYIETSGSFNVSSPFDSLNKKISYADNNITLKKDYVYDSENDTAFAGGILIDKNMTVYGNGHCIDAKGLARIFNVTEGVTLTLVNVTLKNGRADNGGAIYSKGTLVILNSTLKGNHATEQGGAICSNGNLTIADSLIDDNGGKWGAVCVVGTGSIVNSTLSNNNGDVGGAVYNLFANLTISGSNITDNYANTVGAGVYSFGGNVEINSSTLKGNNAPSGSAVWTVYGAGVILNDVRLVDNVGNALTSDDGVAIDTSSVKFLTEVSFKIEDINDTLRGCEITINVTELNKGKEFSGNVTVFIGDENYTVEIINGTGIKKVIPNLSLGIYAVRLIFNETDVYDSASSEGNPFHIRAKPEISIGIISDVDEGTPVTIRVTAVDSFNGDFIVDINGVNYTVSMVNGSGVRTVTLAPGTYNATISFSGNDYYVADVAVSNDFIVRAKPEISIGIISDVDEGTPVTIRVTAVDSFNGDFIVDINGVNYTVSMVNGSGVRTVTLAPGTYNATISFSGNDYFTAGDALSNVFIVRKNINGIRIALSKNTFTYNAKVQKPTVTLSNGLILKEGVDYTLKWSTAFPTKAGTYTITVTGIGAYYIGTTKVTFKINKAANPLKIKAKTVKVKFSKLKKKAQTLKVTKVVKFTKKGQGSLTYKKVKGNKKITINKKNGKVTIKKGLKKGTYKVKVKIKANGNTNYKASAFKTITFKIIIK